MDTDAIIQAEGLGKKYSIGREAERLNYTMLRDVVARTAHDAARSMRNLVNGRAMATRNGADEFWALRDVNFAVRRGDVVGLIGRNGAGKSTLLKILSRITEPSEGRVTLKGRVASLLEVGTGFHPELTGRENVFLNGAILGMTQAETRRKFDEIVEFSEVGRFLDTPVKRYSSGMYVRLAFAVAAHLEPEILVVDEVLAVGDVEFQKKCLGKMGTLSGEGRTVLFVSHNLSAISRLCKSAILLRAGEAPVSYPSVQDGIDAYSQAAHMYSNVWIDDGKIQNDIVEIKSFEISLESGRDPGSVDSYLNVSLNLFIIDAVRDLQIAAALYAHDGTLIFVTSHLDAPVQDGDAFQRGLVNMRFKISTAELNEGSYTIAISALIHNQKIIFSLDDGPKLYFEVHRNYSNSTVWDRKRPGIYAPVIAWKIAHVEGVP